MFSQPINPFLETNIFLHPEFQPGLGYRGSKDLDDLVPSKAAAGGPGLVVEEWTMITQMLHGASRFTKLGDLVGANVAIHISAPRSIVMKVVNLL